MKTDEELRRAFHDLTDHDLPPGFTDLVVAGLPDRRRSTRWRAWTGAGVVAVLGIVVLVSLGPMRSGGDPEISAPPTAVVSPAASVPAAAEGVTLVVESTPGGAITGNRENVPIFELREGRAIYRDFEFGRSVSETKVAFLTDAQVRELVAFATGPGGMTEALTEYERGSFGPSGHTIITLESPELTKTVDYWLAPGNLVRDTDPALGGLPDLMDLLGRFSTAVEQGMASGGMALTDVELAEAIAFGDERFADLLSSTAYETDRVVPALGAGEALVYISVDPDGAAWPEIDACDIGGAEGPATGVVWLVDLAEQTILAVSPRWGTVDCLSGA